MKMWKRNLLLAALMISPLGLFAKMSAFIQPGVSIFSDSLGYDLKAGANLFYLTKDLSLGASISLSGAQSMGTSVFNIALGADVSYDIYLFLFNKLPLVLTPVFTLGWAYDTLNNTNYGSSQKMGVLLAPRAEFSYVIDETMRAGLTVGYSLYQYDIPISYLNAGISFTYFFGVHKLDEDKRNGEKNEKNN